MNTRTAFGLSLAACVFACPAAFGQANIIGGLSNFDCYNETETECDEFEFELEGPHPEDVYHTYRNPNYGSPTIRPNAGNTGIIVTYSNPRHPTARHAIEHFGVSLRNLSQITRQRFTWRHGPVTPPPLPPLPLIDTFTAVDEGEDVLVQRITNVDTHGQYLWIQRRVTDAPREVSLEELLPEDPLIEGSNDLDLAPVLVAPGQFLTSSESVADVIESSRVMSYDVFLDIPRWNGWGYTHTMGNPLGIVMNSSLVAFVCQGSEPIVTLQPQNVTAEFDGRATFTAEGTSDPTYGDLVYQWRFEGVDLEGEDQPTLTVDPVTQAEAGAYTCIIRNDCSRTSTLAAYLTVTGGGDGGECFADYNQDGGVDGADVEEFFNDWELGEGNADVNGDGGIDGSDVESFFTMWSNGGC